jgi:hypothetical protein
LKLLKTSTDTSSTTTSTLASGVRTMVCSQNLHPAQCWSRQTKSIFRRIRKVNPVRIVELSSCRPDAFKFVKKDLFTYLRYY